MIILPNVEELQVNIHFFPEWTMKNDLLNCINWFINGNWNNWILKDIYQFENLKWKVVSCVKCIFVHLIKSTKLMVLSQFIDLFDNSVIIAVSV
jgi:hypothetical protein